MVSTKRKTHVILVLALTVLAANGRAEPQGDQPPATDRYGDPLPPGATLRLGTVRLRHPPFVESLAFSVDGKTLFSTGRDSSLRQWDVATGKELRRFEGVHIPALSEDRKLAAWAAKSAHPPWAIRLLDVATGKELPRLPEPAISNALAFSPDGKRLLSGGEDNFGGSGPGTMRLWDIATRKVLRQFRGHKDPIVKVAFAPNGKLLASQSQGDGVRLWDATTGKELHQLPADYAVIQGPVFSPDSKTVATAHQKDACVRLWDVATGKELRKFTGDRRHFVTAFAFAPDGKTLASGTEHAVHLWDLATGKELQQITAHYFSGGSCLAYSPDGKMLATGSGWDGTIRLWDIVTRKEIRPFDEHLAGVWGIAFSPDCRTMATGSSDMTCRLWDAEGKLRQRCVGHEQAVFQVCFAPDGKTLASAGQDQTIRLWDAATGRQLRQLPALSFARLAFSPDGRTMATGGHQYGDARTQAIQLWDAGTGKELGELTVQEVKVENLAYWPDGKTLVSASLTRSDEDTTIRLWDVATGKERHRWTVRKPDGMRISPDGKTLVTVGEREILLWDVAAGKVRRRIVFAQENRPWFAVVSPDGKMLASVGHEAKIQLWEVATCQERRRFEGHQDRVTSMVFSPDSKRLLSGGAESSTLVWDVTGQGRPGRRNLGVQEVKALFDDLAGADAGKAYRAMVALTGDLHRSLACLQEHLQAVAAADPGKIARLVAELDSPRFQVREKAGQELEDLGEQAEPALRHALDDKPSLEVRQRVDKLLEKLDGPVNSGEPLRALRAIEVLEWIGTPEARQVLQALAKGAPEARLTREAKAALDRLARR